MSRAPITVKHTTQSVRRVVSRVSKSQPIDSRVVPDLGAEEWERIALFVGLPQALFRLFQTSSFLSALRRLPSLVPLVRMCSGSAEVGYSSPSALCRAIAFRHQSDGVADWSLIESRERLLFRILALLPWKTEHGTVSHVLGSYALHEYLLQEEAQPPEWSSSDIDLFVEHSEATPNVFTQFGELAAMALSWVERVQAELGVELEFIGVPPADDKGFLMWRAGDQANPERFQEVYVPEGEPVSEENAQRIAMLMRVYYSITHAPWVGCGSGAKHTPLPSKEEYKFAVAEIRMPSGLGVEKMSFIGGRLRSGSVRWTISSILDDFDIDVCKVGMHIAPSQDCDGSAQGTRVLTLEQPVRDAIASRRMKVVKAGHHATPHRVKKYESRGFVPL